MKQYHLNFLCFVLLILGLSGCASQRLPSMSKDEVLATASELDEAAIKAPRNPKFGEIIWGNLRVGMTVSEAAANLAGATIDIDGKSIGMGSLEVFSRAGIVARNRILIASDVVGPFNKPSRLFLKFDEARRLDGIIFYTTTANLPDSVTRMKGTLGFLESEFFEALRIIVRQAIPELGVPFGAPTIGGQALESFGIVGLAAVSPKAIVGFSMPSSSTTFVSFIQNFKRQGFITKINVQSAYLGLYSVYSGIHVIMSMEAPNTNSD